MKWLLLTATAAAVASSPASALKIELNDTGGLNKTSIAYHDFRIAAEYWESQFKNNVTVNLDVGFQSLGPEGANILGQTGSTRYVDSTAVFEQAIAASAHTTTAIKAAANLPTLHDGSINVITPGYNDVINKLGANARTRLYDDDGTTNNSVLYSTTANAKALGLLGDTTTADGSVAFNSDFRFDFDPSNGIAGDRINFLQVAIHEIGHALGFVSGVDDYDYIGCPDGPGCSTYLNYDANNDYWGSTLDLYRYSANPTDLLDSFGKTIAAGPTLDWSIRNLATDGAAYANPYFSIDGGASALFGNLESRGQYNSNSYQASHWRSATIAGQPYLGIMDPVGANDKDYSITALDLAAFNAIGWDTVIDPLLDSGYQAFTGDIYSASNVPEPATWALMIGGFTMVGAAARRSRKDVTA